MQRRALLLALTVLLCLPRVATGGQPAVSVSSQKELLRALLDPSVNFIRLQRSIRLWTGGRRLHVDRNLTISGPELPSSSSSSSSSTHSRSPAASAAKAADADGASISPAQAATSSSATAAAVPGAAAATPVVSLDVAHQSGILLVDSGVLLVLQNLWLLSSVVEWDPGLAFVFHSPNARVRLHYVVRPNPLCPPSVEWLRSGLEATPIPAKYSPPVQLYDEATQGRFHNRMRVWNASECQQQWVYPETCRSQGGITSHMAYEMPARTDNRLAFDYSEAMGLYEYFNVSFPCAGWVDPRCVQARGYPACFNDGIKRIIWWDRLLHRKWQIAVGILAAAAAAVMSTIWLRQQQEQWQRQQNGQPAGSAKGSDGSRQAAAGSGSGSGSVPLAEVIIADSAFKDITFGSLVGAGGFGRVYAGEWRGQPVAIKVMELSKSRDLRLARHELDVNMLLQHANVVRCHDYQIMPQERHGTAPSSSTAGLSTSTASIAATTAATVSGLGPGLLTATQDSHSSAADEEGEALLVQVMLLMEYCDCGSLRSAISAGLLRRPITGQASRYNNMVSVLRIALDIAKGMQHLHQHNVCHGDLTSNNVLLCSSQDVPQPLSVVAKVADFGLSRLMPDQGTHLSTLSHGTITHMAPEVLQTGRVRLAADVYSYGILLWEMVHLGTPMPASTSSSHEANPGTATQPLSDAPAGSAQQLLQERGNNASRASRRSSVITGVYQGSSTAPWTIASRVIDGMRPVFTAPAVPGPYRALAERCWDAEPSKRPSFAEIVAMLESVVDADGVGDENQQGAAAVASFD